MINIQGYTTAELAARWAISRQRVSALAKKHRWGCTLVGSTKVYTADDVDEYQFARWRTKLQKELGGHLGRPGQGLFTDDSYDLDCPTCGAFAVYRKPATAEDEIAWLAGKAANTWRCVKGHRGKS